MLSRGRFLKTFRSCIIQLPALHFSTYFPEAILACFLLPWLNLIDTIFVFNLKCPLRALLKVFFVVFLGA